MKDATNHVLTQFFRQGRRCTYAKGEIILRAADTPQGAYMIESGHVKVYTLTEQGEENIHIIYKPGEIFPLAWLFRDYLRNVFYEAIDQASIWIMPKELLLGLVQNDGSITYNLLRQTVEQFHVYSDRVDNLEYRSAHERIVYRLLFLAGRFGVQDGTAVIINVPITHHHIARSINLARETASRELEKLERRGLIHFEHQRIVIPDIEKLQNEIGEPTSLDIWGLKPPAA